MQKNFNVYFSEKLDELAEKLSAKTEQIENIINDDDVLDEMEAIFITIDNDFKQTCYDVFEAAERSGGWKENDKMFSEIIATLDDVKKNIIQLKCDILKLIVPDFSMVS